MKHCYRCKETKARSEFGRNAGKSDGLSTECRACRKIMKADYYGRNAKLIISRNFAYRRAHPDVRKLWEERNPEKLAAQRRRYLERHPSRPAEQSVYFREYYKRNAERIKRQAHVWHHQNPERAAETIRAWKERNAEKVRLYAINGQARRRARKRGGRVTTVDLAAIRVRDRMRCHLCNRKVSERSLSFDHVSPLSRGGAHEPGNIKVAHLSCNIRKHNKIIPVQLEMASE